MFNLNKKNFKNIDLPLIISLAGLLIFGLIVLYSASLSLPANIMVYQGLATLVGLVAMVIVIYLDYDFIKSLYKCLYLGSIFLMILLILFGVGADEWGADIWLTIGPISFQPSEFVKIGLIIFIAVLLEENYYNINKPLTLLKVLVLSMIPITFIVYEDFGSAAVLVFVLALMLFSAGLSWRYIAAAFLGLLITGPIAYQFFDEYQKDRIKDFLNPTRDVAGTGFQAMQGRIAVGSGKLFGRGLFQGMQTQNDYIPEKQTDYIFAVLAEEWGFLGVLVVLILYGILLYRMLRISEKAKDKYGSFLTVGIAAMLLIHIFENIGMTLGIMPVTGIPLPFMSHGGTFQLINLIAIGLVLQTNVEKDRLDFS